jgi:hypothetical protein
MCFAGLAFLYWGVPGPVRQAVGLFKGALISCSQGWREGTRPCIHILHFRGQLRKSTHACAHKYVSGLLFSVALVLESQRLKLLKCVIGRKHASGALRITENVLVIL